MTIKECLAVALIGLYFFAVPPVKACDCMWWAYTALKHTGVRIQTVPALVQTNAFKYPGAYGRGVMYVRDVDNCSVILHELVHHVQWLRYSDAQDMHEWQRRENQAAALVTMLAESEGRCE